jgi:hypothetical protein
MRLVRALPIVQLMLAVCSRQSPVATAVPGGRPGKNERPHPSPGTPHRPSRDRTRTGSAHPDKAGRRRAHLASATCQPHHRRRPLETVMT